MFKKIATMIGYAKAPKTTLVLKHPVKGTQALLAAKGVKSLLTAERAKRLMTGRTGATLGALVALPLTVLAVKGMRSGEAEA